MQPKVFRTGEPVTAEFMTDISQAVFNAEKKSAEAKADSQNAQNSAAEALQKSETALADSNSANSNSASAQYTAQLAFEKAAEIERRANEHEFDGRDGKIIEEKGLLAFTVENGQLYVYYFGDEAPNLSIDEATGELIYNY